MFKIIRSKTILAIALLVVGGGALYSFRVFSNSQLNNKREPVQTVLVGTGQYKETFNESVKSSKAFYDFYSEAKRNMMAGNYDEAIRLFNKSLPHVEFGPEKAMVYRKLATIYNAQRNLELELKYTELVPKYSANSELNEQYLQRAAELRQLLASRQT